MKKIILYAVSLLLCPAIFSQSLRTNLDDLAEIKDAGVYQNMSFDNIQYYKSDKAAIPDFSGKLLIIDCWFKECTGCVKAFRKIDSLQKELTDYIQFLIVSMEADSVVTKHLYSKKPELCQLIPRNIPTIWEDSAIWPLFSYKSLPYIFIRIDNDGEIEKAWQGDLSRNIIEYCLGRRESFQ